MHLMAAVCMAWVIRHEIFTETEVIHMPMEFACVETFAGQSEIAKAFKRKGLRSAALDLVLNEKDESWPFNSIEGTCACMVLTCDVFLHIYIYN